MRRNRTHRYQLQQLHPIRLPADQRFLQVDFALSNYFKPRENQYAYRLEGLNEDWISLGKQPSLILNNLPAGDYRLLVKGGDPLGNWTQQPLVIPIHVGAFFYQQWWFYVLLFALIAGASLLWIMRLRTEVKAATSKIRQDKELIEEQAERLREMDAVKSRFFTNISHELRTPLTIIGGMVQQIRKSPSKWSDKGLRMIERNNNQLLDLVNQILDLRKLETGSLQLKLVQDDIIAYLRYLTESFQSLAEKQGIRLHFLTHEREIIMAFDQEKMLRIVSNLLSNAIKFTPENGDVYLLVEQALGRVQAQLEDDSLQVDGGTEVPAAPTLPLLLIVEDNRDVQLYLQALLEGHYRLLLAEDGQQGIDLALEHIPDLILSDVMMPEKDGYEVCDTLKQDERTSHIPIILLTAKADADSRIAGLKRGADAYLAKPFHPEELLVRLAKLLEIRRRLQERYRQLDALPSSPDERLVQEDAFITKLQAAVLERLDDEQFGIAELCRIAGMSRSQLHLKLKALTGRSASHFIRYIRLHKAKELLEQTSMSVTEIAFEVGFNDPSYFSRSFSEVFGAPPSTFVRS